MSYTKHSIAMPLALLSLAAVAVLTTACEASPPAGPISGSTLVAPASESPAAAPGGQTPIAPTNQDTPRGQMLFTQKCAGCHTIGGGKLLGPDLKGVTARRPRGWLIEFIVAPDRVIARGDPVAVELLKEYGLPMLNTGVSDAEAQEILAYIER